MHMHFGAEEMFFVLSGRPVFRNQHGEECSGRLRFLPEDVPDYTFSNPTETAQILAISAGSFPDVVAYPEHGYAWWRLAIPIPSYSREAATPASSPAGPSREDRSSYCRSS